MLVGRGMATEPVIGAEVFGWFIEHPHSGYLTQFYLTGAVGLMLLMVVLAWGVWQAVCLARHGETLLLILLAGGGAALVFDGGHILSALSEGRMEMLLVVIPSALAVARRGVMQREKAGEEG